MNFKKKIKSININKLPSFLLGVFIIIIVIVAILISANKILEYAYVQKENELLESEYENKLREIDELRYYIDSEVDEAYRERMARLLGYCYPDEIIYYIE